MADRCGQLFHAIGAGQAVVAGIVNDSQESAASSIFLRGKRAETERQGRQEALGEEEGA
ncbi:MAG: hypothetical protein GVY26_09705 [Bacteroidetes bacterium]|nr:hypothetical protein [Bacteroidota bacterium]